MELSKLTFELPTGKLADMYGDKIPLVLSGLLGAILWLGYPLFSGNLMVYYGSALLLGISEALITGSKVMILAAVLAGFVSGWLYTFSIFYCFIAISAINLMKACIPLIAKFTITQHPAASQQTTLLQSLTTCTKYIWALPRLRGILFSSFFVTMACDMVMRYYQPYLLSYGIKVEYAGYVFSFAAILAWMIISLGARYDQLVNRFPLLRIVLIDIAGALLCSLLAITQQGKSVILMLSLLLSIEDMRSPVVRGFLSKVTYGFRYKAMLFSFYSVIESAGETLAGILFGWVVAYYGPEKWFFHEYVLVCHFSSMLYTGKIEK